MIMLLHGVGGRLDWPRVDIKLTPENEHHLLMCQSNPLHKIWRVDFKETAE